MMQVVQSHSHAAGEEKVFLRDDFALFHFSDGTSDCSAGACRSVQDVVRWQSIKIKVENKKECAASVGG